jgi:hypothetical protein
MCQLYKWHNKRALDSKTCILKKFKAIHAMFTIRYFTPYQQEWRTQTFSSLDEAKRMVDFYRSCGSPANLV